MTNIVTGVEAEMKEAMRACFTAMTNFLAETCPDDMMWEDYAPELDEARLLIEKILSTGNIKAP